ncbi:MAG: type IV pilus biogenesis/stability protein PilW [Rubrivivax sp.]
MSNDCIRLLLRAASIGGLTMVLAACVSTSTSTSTAAPPGPNSAAAPAEPADPDRRARLRLELAGLYLSRGQGTTALEEIKRALAAKPDMPEAYSLRGLIYDSLDQPVLAEESFKRSLQLAPRDGDVMHNYGWFLCQRKRYVEADAIFEQTLLQPAYREAVRTRLAQGVCLARAGSWAEAERALQRSYELDPSNPVTGYNLGEVLLHRGEAERARFYLGRINAVREQTTAQSLWLAARIENRIGNIQARQDLGRQLQARFPDSPEAMRFERGGFDE